MTGGSLGLRGSYGSMQSSAKISPAIGRKPSSKMLLSGGSTREREHRLLFLPLVISCFVGRRRVSMLLLLFALALALLVFVWGPFSFTKDSDVILSYDTPFGIAQYFSPVFFDDMTESTDAPFNTHSDATSLINKEVEEMSYAPPSRPKDAAISAHPCHNFSLPPPPPLGGRRIGPRPCPVCYLPAEQARARMPSSTSLSPVLRNLTYVVDKYPVKIEPHGGSEFGGYPSLDQRIDSFDIRDSMTVHCGFVKGGKPGRQTGFDIDESDILELDRFHEVIVASAIFGNYDMIQQPQNISEAARKHVPFYMFIDEETKSYMKNSSVLDSSMRVGLWRIIVVRNVPYSDPRRNGKVPKLLLHRIFPNVRYSIWIDGKLQLVVDPYQLLERFLLRGNANFAISNHYRRFDVFQEAEANKAAGKYDNASIDSQIDFYKKEGLTPFSEAKFPIISDVPEGCVLIREHVPITNLFSCLWFNEVDRFTSRDQLSFSTVRDKIMAKVNWSINMFMDCERRNFVIQAYHKEILDHMPPPVTVAVQPWRPGSSAKRPPKRHRKERPGWRQHRRDAAGNKGRQATF